MAKTILIAEDEPTILKLLKSYFEQDGFFVFDAKDGEEAFNIFRSTHIDLVCLDVMMPKINGFDLAKMIRSSSDVPIIIMTALQSEEDVLKGYSLLVDDYVTKPFNPKILIAKAKNILLRLDQKQQFKKEYQIGKLKFDFVNNEVFLDGNKLNLASTEFNLLAYLAKNSGKVCSRNLLLDEVWGLDVYVDERIIDVNIKNIRKALGNYRCIKTVFKQGYQFEA